MMLELNSHCFGAATEILARVGFHLVSSTEILARVVVHELEWVSM